MIKTTKKVESEIKDLMVKQIKLIDDLRKAHEADMQVRHKAETESVIVKETMEQYNHLISYNLAQSQTINMMYRKLANVGAFLKELTLEFDFVNEDSEILTELITKYNLNEIIPQDDFTENWQ